MAQSQTTQPTSDVQVISAPNLPVVGAIEVLIGKLNTADDKILQAMVLPELHGIDLGSGRGQIAVRVRWKSSLQDYVTALKNPQNLGVVYIGHPALQLTDDNKQVQDFFLQSSEAFYLPKTIFSAAHANMRFLGLVSCHEPGLSQGYLDHVQPQSKVVLPLSMDFSDQAGDVSNTLANLTNIITGPKEVLQQIADLAPKLDAASLDAFIAAAANPAQPKGKLEVKVRDLLSAHYAYTIEVNDRFVGEIHAQIGESGRAQNQTVATIAVDLNPGDRIKISPDDPKRIVPSSIQGGVIDDILVDSVNYTAAPGTQAVSLLDKVAHIGDDARDVDLNISLSRPVNSADFANAAPEAELVVGVNPAAPATQPSTQPATQPTTAPTVAVNP